MQRVEVREQLRVLREARVIALDIIPGAVPIETYRFPERCLMLFGAEGPGLSEKAVSMADDVVYISQFGSVRSINAGAAAAVAMHCWIAQRHVGPVVSGPFAAARSCWCTKRSPSGMSYPQHARNRSLRTHGRDSRVCHRIIR